MTKKADHYESREDAAKAADSITAVRQTRPKPATYLFEALLFGEWEVLRSSSRPYAYAHIHRAAVNGNLAATKLGAFVSLTNNPEPNTYAAYKFRETVRIQQA